MTFPRTIAVESDDLPGPFVPHFLELLTSRLDLAQLRARTNLAKLVIAMHAHCVTSMDSLIHVLLNIGLRPENIIFIEKPYSTIPSAAAALRKRGIGVDTKAIRFPPGEYDVTVGGLIEEGIARALGRCLDIEAQTLVLVDDGGILSEKVAKQIGRVHGLRAISI